VTADADARIGERHAAKQQGQHLFPVPAKHTYGDGFGAGRDHQGQDVFARCGKKIVAARGGRVQVSGTHGSAGNYVVIDGAGTKWDYAYMHLQKRPPKEGTRIGTGEVIGFVGESGNASGCHLHFEMWDAPGYYEGGKARRSVTKHLKSWDRYS
jgi:murein DD-endopeptidase MepM/ murein hydrolase activator NlpD